MDGKRFWFRCFWAFDKALLTWWDDQTHIYSEITDEEINNFGLMKMYSITKTIAKITELDFFSTDLNRICLQKIRLIWFREIHGRMH